MARFWYEKPRQTVVPDDYPENVGDLTPEKCPSCGGRVLYNGNYACEFWGTTYEGTRLGGPCSWALPHPATSKVDREIALRLDGSVE